MVKIDKIYTRAGDGGETSLVNGIRVRKDTPRITLIGDVDEANAILGLARQSLEKGFPILDVILARVQNDLFDLGADLATPGHDPSDGSLRIQKQQGERLEIDIDYINGSLKPLKSFVLPGGNPAASWLHLARTVVRRAERSAVSLSACESINTYALVYLNRLSDLLFVMAREANDSGKSDKLWEPGKYGRTL